MRGSTVAVPQRRRRLDPDTGRHRRLSSNQRHVKIRPQASPGAGERVNAELKNWCILRKIRSSQNAANKPIAAAQRLTLTES